MEKKKLMDHWNSSLAGMKQRDEAYVVTQELLRYGLKPGPEDTSDLGRRDSRRGFQGVWSPGGFSRACAQVHNKFKG